MTNEKGVRSGPDRTPFSFRSPSRWGGGWLQLSAAAASTSPDSVALRRGAARRLGLGASASGLPSGVVPIAGGRIIGSRPLPSPPSAARGGRPRPRRGGAACSWSLDAVGEDAWGASCPACGRGLRSPRGREERSPPVSSLRPPSRLASRPSDLSSRGRRSRRGWLSRASVLRPSLGRPALLLRPSF